MKYIFFLGWIFTFGANAQNVVSVHLNDVLCHLKSHELAKHISDSLENRIHIYDDSIRNHFPNHCTIGWDEKRCEKWGMDYERLVKEQDELVTVYFTVYDSLNNEIREN